jgi:hypothetical protein
MPIRGFSHRYWVCFGHRVDGIIDPLETWKLISMGIEAANQSTIKKIFNLDILQNKKYK